MKRYNTIILYTIVCLYWFSLYVYTPIFSTYVISLGASMKMAGLIFGSYGFTQMLLRVPLGILSDRIKIKKVILIIGLASCLLSNLGFWFCNNLIIISLLRSLAGVAASTWVVFHLLLFNNFKYEKIAIDISYLHSIGKLAVTVSLFVGGLVAKKFGEKYTFFLATIVSVLALILSIGINGRKTDSSLSLKREKITIILKNKTIFLASILEIITSIISMGAIFSFLPIYAKNIGADNFDLGILTTYFALAGVIASFLSVRVFLNNFKERKSIIIGFIAITVSCIMVSSVKDINNLFSIPIICGFGNSLIVTLTMVMSIKNVPRNSQGTTIGILQAVNGLGMFVGPILMGFIIELFGIIWAFRIIGSIGLLGIIITKYFITINLLRQK